MKFITFLYDGGQAVPEISRGIFTPEWVNRLYRNLTRHAKDIEFICLVDTIHMLRYREFDDAISLVSMGRDWGNMFALLECFNPKLWEKGSDRAITMGLDTIIVNDLRALMAYDGDFAMTKDPIQSGILCSGVMAFNGPKMSHLYQKLLDDQERDEQKLLGHPSDMIWLNQNVEKIDTLDKFLPIGYLQSYSQHWYPYNPGRDKAHLVYFHGQHKPHNINDPVLTTEWTGMTA